MRTFIKKLSTKHKNNRFWYYTKNFVRQLLPKNLYQCKLNKKLAGVHDNDVEYLKKRINYYNKLTEIISLTEEVKCLRNFKLKKKHKTYFFDSYEYTR